MKEHCSHCYATPQHHLMLSGLNQLTSANKNPGSPQVLLMAATFAQGRPLLRGREVPPSSELAFLPLFCSPPGLRPCPGAMEPTASDLRLVPGAAKDVLAADAMCCRMALSTVMATSIILVTLGVLVGEWPWACLGPHTRRLAERCLGVAQGCPRAKGRAYRPRRPTRARQGGPALDVAALSTRLGTGSLGIVVIPANFRSPTYGVLNEDSWPG